MFIVHENLDAQVAYLDEIEAGEALTLNHKDGKMRVRLFDAVVEHSDKHVGILGEIYHELLMLLHLHCSVCCRVCCRVLPCVASAFDALAPAL